MEIGNGSNILANIWCHRICVHMKEFVYVCSYVYVHLGVTIFKKFLAFTAAADFWNPANEQANEASKLKYRTYVGGGSCANL